MSDPFHAYPYRDDYPVLRAMPETGRDRSEVLAELHTIAAQEDQAWESGQCSGTIYLGNTEHYDFLSDVFGQFAHQNALQRDMCPSATRFEGEILAMALDLMHADAASATGTTPAGLVTSGGTDSILHAMLCYREDARARGVERPTIIKPETAHPAFTKAAHLFGMDLRVVPADPTTTLVDPAVVAAEIDANTAVIVGSAGNYPYGTVDPIADLGALAAHAGVGLHVDGCLGGFILPFAEELGYAVPQFDFRVPGVTSISADTHKYGYGLKGTSTVLFRDKALRNRSYFFVPDWSGGKYFSPGMAGSRSVGLLASTWASMVTLGRAGYRERARGILEVAAGLADAVRSQPSLRLVGDSPFVVAFASDEIDIYHVNDAMRARGWRFNGLQYPNALHIAVTGPQLQDGVVQRFSSDLAASVEYAVEREGTPAQSAALYGGVPGGLTPAASMFITAVMTQMMDAQQTVPSGA
jgi:sphinganine-1-phosphate aldolase